NRDLFDDTTAQRLCEHYRQILAAIVAQPERPISELPLLAEAERRRTLVSSNETRKAVPSLAVHELFTVQAARTPAAVAVVFEEQSLSYGELDRRANRLARRLRGLGVAPGALAALHAERSLDMMVGLLAILKA